MPLSELREHLFTLPEHPDWIPFRTTYFKEAWGLCLAHRQLAALPEDDYEVCIESSLEDGYLTYGELVLRGETPEEVLVSSHVCHPSLCNDNLSGVAVAAFLARQISAESRRYTYRFLFLPATIGSITWLARNEAVVPRIKHGLVLACLGDEGHSTYKRSRRGDAEVDRASAHVLQHSGQEYVLQDFSPFGYDERQFCSPGFNLPVGSLRRTPNGCFPEYHTSADNLEFVQPGPLADSLAKCRAIFRLLEHNRTYLNLRPKCEPQLGKRGLYHTVTHQSAPPPDDFAVLWVLNLSDGKHDLLDIAERAGMSFDVISRAADALASAGLLREVRAEETKADATTCS